MKPILNICYWCSQHELWFIALAIPFLLFPIGGFPWFGLFIIGLTWICRKVTYGYFTICTGVEIPSLILIIMAIVGFWISVEPGMSKARLWNVILDLAIFYGLANSLKPNKQLRGIIIGLAAITIGITILSLLGTDWSLTRYIDIPWLYERIPTIIRGLPNSGVPIEGSDLINPRWIGITMGVLTPVLLAFAWFLKDRLLRIVSLITAIIGIGLLLLTQTVQGLIGMCAGILFLLVWRRRWLILLPLPILILLASSSLLIDIGKAGEFLITLDNPVGKAIVLRLDIWSRGLNMIRDMPLTGIGINTFPLIQTHFYPGFLLGPEPHAHNLYLQTALDLGIPGLIALLWFFIAWAVRVRVNYQNNQRQAEQGYLILLAGIFAAVISYLTHGFMDAMMLGAKPSVIVWGLLGIASATPITEPRKNPRSNKYRFFIPWLQQVAVHLLPLFIIFSIALIILLIKPAILNMNIGAVQAHLGLYPAQSVGSPNFPRMEEAKAALQKVIALDGEYLNAHELIGQIYTWEGQHSLAVDAFAHRVALDHNNPLSRYFPPGSWLKQLQGIDANGDNNWDDLITIYSHWMHRFPKRAGLYVEMSLVWQCSIGNPAQAYKVVSSGLENHAMPVELLEYYQNQLTLGDDLFCKYLK